jgi:protein SCO1/2
LTGDFGTVLAPPQQVDNFTLTDTSGNPLPLGDLEGNYTLLSFGYTHCPDVCPLTLTEYRRVKRDLGDMAENVNFVFVSVDGERDTPELLNRYLGRFDPAFIGLTTDDDSLMQTIASDFNVFYEKREIEGTQAGYMVDHTASLFLLNPRGEVIVLYPFGTPPVDIAADIRALVS